MHRSSYKYWLKRKEHIDADFTILCSEVKAAHRISNGSAGARTIAQLVTNKGIGLSRYRVRNLTEKLYLFYREPVGWALSLSPNSELTCKALNLAFELRGKPDNVIYHSD